MDSIKEFFTDISPETFLQSQTLWEVGSVIGLLVTCWFALALAKRAIHGWLGKLIQLSDTVWDDALHREGVFSRLAPLLPALIAWYGAPLIPHPHENVEIVLRRCALALMIFVGVRSLAAFLTAANAIYSRNPANRDRPIKGYLQVATIITHLIAAILILSVMMDRSPWLFLSGIGALTAVLLLVFRDTLLSLVASISLTGNDMIHVGDWIEMPQYQADGDVIDIALHTVKIQNFDKTITTIPTYQLLNSSFKNWRGMSQSGGRRIKRSIQIDIGSVRFLTDEEIGRFATFDLLGEYIAAKKEELANYNSREGIDSTIPANARNLTNLGTFRAYLERYLASHPKIHGSMTRIVRQLAPTAEGLPIEIYCFTRTTKWAEYEAIQGDIFDHVLALLSEFDLRIYQSPAGMDIDRAVRDFGVGPRP